MTFSAFDSPPTSQYSSSARRNVAALRFNLLTALAVWVLWAVFGGHNALNHLISDWRIAVAMVFGSLVGGGTSVGGGAIAFPIFTKLLYVAPRDASNFSLAIQSVGMGAATLSILYLRIPIERRSLLHAGVPGIAGLIFGGFFVAPHIPPVFVRTSFTVLVSSMGVALLLVNWERSPRRNSQLPMFGFQEKLILIVAGFVGGVISALIGTGENTILFMVLVLLFRINEMIATPTTVILMTMVTIPGFLLHAFLLKDFTSTVIGYWLAAIPVVVVGGPLGALICSEMKRHSVVLLLLFLIVLDFVSTMLQVSLSPPVLLVSLLALLVFGFADILMSRSRRYRPRDHEGHKR